MSLTVAIRFTLGSGNVDFYSDEVRDSVLITDKTVDVQANQRWAPYLFEYIGAAETFWKYNITIHHFLRTTRAKIESLVAEEDEMTCYYEYAYDASTSIKCILDPLNIKTVYEFGEYSATNTTLNFLEST